MLNVQRTAGNQVVQRLLDPAFEDTVYETEAAERRASLDAAAGGTIAADDPRRSALTEHLLGTDRATARTAPPPVGQIAANDPRRSALTEHLLGTDRATARTAPPAVGQIAANDPRRSALTEHFLGTDRAATARTTLTPGKIAANAPRDSALTEHLLGTDRAPTARTTPTPGKIAANAPRDRALTEHLLGTDRAPTARTTTTPGKIAAADPRLAEVAANLKLHAKRKADEEAAAKAAAGEMAFQAFVSGANVVLTDQSPEYGKKLRLLFKRWTEAKAVGLKQEINATKADLDRGATVEAKQDRDDILLAAQIEAHKKQQAAYNQRFATLLQQVPTKINDTNLQAEVTALLTAVKVEIDKINTQSGNVSSNFGSDLQATAKGTFSPTAVAWAGTAWSSGLFRFAAKDQAYRGPSVKGEQSKASATNNLPQANFEAPISATGKGKINVHVTAGLKGGKDAYTVSVADASKQTNIGPGEIVKMAIYFKHNAQPLGVSRRNKSGKPETWFSQYDLGLLKQRHKDTNKPWFSSTTTT